MLSQIHLVKKIPCINCYLLTPAWQTICIHCGKNHSVKEVTH